MRHSAGRRIVDASLRIITQLSTPVVEIVAEYQKNLAVVLHNLVWKINSSRVQFWDHPKGKPTLRSANLLPPSPSTPKLSRRAVLEPSGPKHVDVLFNLLSMLMFELATPLFV